MKTPYLERLESQLKRIFAQSKSSSPGEQAFSRQFYAKTALADLERLEPGHAAAISSSAYQFMNARIPGVPKIRVFTPVHREHGYESRRLIVELINDDMPFLVDSLTAELTRLGFVVHETLHPIFSVSRDRKGHLEQVVADADTKTKGFSRESFIHFELSSLPEEITAEALVEQLESVLAYVRASFEGWHSAVEQALEAERALDDAGGEFTPQEVEEAKAFLTWLRQRNFVFLGYTDGRTKLGICTIDNSVGLSQSTGAVVSILKSGMKSPVHRPVLMDVISVKQFDARGKVVGERQFVGLFTSTVYYQSADGIPVVRRKIARVLSRAGFDPTSHDGKALRAIMEFLPRDEMFQIGEEELFDLGMGILALEARPGVRLFARRDVLERFVSCMVFVPREYFSTSLRVTIIDMLTKAYQGEAENFYTQMTESPLARLHIIIRTRSGFIPDVDIGAIESDIARFTHLWGDALRDELAQHFNEQETESVYRTYAQAFPPAYVSRYSISATVFDIVKSNEALAAGGLALDFYRVKDEADFLHLKLYNPAEEIALSDIIPVLENMGLRAIDEHPFLIHLHDGRTIWIRDFKLTFAGAALVLGHVKPLFEEALLKVWRREVENDRFNALVLRAGMSVRQVTMLRAYAKYLRQAGFAFPQATIEQVMMAQPQLAKQVVALFEARFTPGLADQQDRQEHLAQQIDAQLAQVKSLTDDRVLRQYVALINATLRTNYYQQDAQGNERAILSFKFRSSDVPGLPKPVPYVEIFVYSPRVEGIHLRGGKVARGGLRWSDRHEDFRTEVLGLMKAQMVKNSVIVPVGSKGGFVVKRPSAAREEMQQEGVACYTLYLTGLLDLTDNIVNGTPLAPERLVRYDDYDPYLVVAADKGTASFSDIANGVSKQYGFWLDDAFASGGSAGYDHKEMAITARGGWISVVRHFREMDIDITQAEFTCAGIGDMAGDVFGNGMLLSSKLKLVAAFNHMHIFLDPSPNAAASFEERKRLFHLPRSTWKDYDSAKISKGGGVFERSAKTITLSPEIQSVLGTTRASVTPDELIRIILSAPVDLLWNGGIGTYVKAEEESHDQVGDRANNAVRVNGTELRCKVVGEGGNLGFTQKGRIEYARTGGRINTDAIDNSAGVDCSDHEVNIKIAFAGALASAKLTREKRDSILSAMTDEVAGLVLKDNFLQTQAITIAQQQGAALLESQGRLMQRLEKQGLLDRAIEFLPTAKQLAEMQAKGTGLTRPEIAVLLAYSKIALCRELLDSTLPDEAYFTADLARYFPKAMQKDFAAEIAAHPLKREIIATVATNSLVNRAGITFFFDMADDSNMPPREVAAAYTIARDAFGLRDVWAQVEALSGTIPPVVQVEMLAAVNRLIERVTLWVLRHLPQPLDIDTVMAGLKPGIDMFRRSLPAMHSPATKKAYDKVFAQLLEANVPTATADTIASLDMLSSATGVIRVAAKTGLSISDTGSVYFALGHELRFGWLRHYTGMLQAQTHWDRLAAQALVQDLYDEQRRLTLSVLEGLKKPEGAFERWKEQHADAIARYSSFIEDLRARDSVELSGLLVALKHARTL